MKEFII